MRLRVGVALPSGGERIVSLSCDVTATVSDAARVLIRAGLSGDRRLQAISEARLAPVTLRARPSPDDRFVLLDPAAPLASSGLRSGWSVAPALEAEAGSDDERAVEPAGHAEVLNGPQRGARFTLVRGRNLVGRDRACRVLLLDRSVSRRHAEAVVDGDGLALRDLGSANRIVVDGERRDALRCAGATEVRFGETLVRLVPEPSSGGRPSRPAALRAGAPHTRSPRVAPVFLPSEHELPTPPARPQAVRVPLLAMLVPMLMGGVMYLVTGSPYSLLMIAFSPAMALGSWLDGKAGGAKRFNREAARFDDELEEERERLTALRTEEIAVRGSEAPGLDEVRSAIAHRGELLWTRRAEHRSFLELRLGEGELPSRTRIVLPQRGEEPGEQRQRLERLAAQLGCVAPVPVVERLERCGSLGVAGASERAEGLASALILQLVGLHSPRDLVLACFASSRQAENWSWLTWLPHVNPAASPLAAWQLADCPQSALRLLTALEALLEARRSGRAATTEVRSHLEAGEQAGETPREAVARLPMLPAVVVVVLDTAHVDRSRLIEIAELGPEHGIHTLWVAEHRTALPAACRTFVEAGGSETRVHFVRTATTAPLTRHEHLDTRLAHEAARALAPVEDSAARALDESDLPDLVDLRDLHPVDLLGGPEAVLRAWRASGSITASWRAGEARDPVSLAACVGQGLSGPAIVDLRAHGPHALVGGTTGAGKSEFLQTWIMSLAAHVSPDRLAYLLIDYKGGAAFAECVDLPHTVGLVTDLTPRLVRRALTSLRAELRYREELLAAHGAKDLVSMERRSDPSAPPALILVIDEFAALAADVPEFVDGVVDIAQRGRSLGLHLVMATQRPAGVIKENLRANTNLRIALRMADASDSTDVIGVADAASFDAAAPGRGAIKIGAGRLIRFQSGYLGGRASDTDREPQIEIRSLRFSRGEPWRLPPDPSLRAPRTDRPRDIERLRDGIAAAARRAGIARPRRPWLDELPPALSLASLRAPALGRAAATSEGGTGSATPDPPPTVAGDPPLGLRDDPEAQARQPLTIDFETAGNVAFSGAGGTGKTSALIALAAALSEAVDREPVQIYAIDAAGGALDAIAGLPTVGAVVPLGDADRLSRLLRRLAGIVAERSSRFAAARADGLASYRAQGGAEREARVLLLVDGFAALRQATETLSGEEQPLRTLAEIMAAGRAAGVHVVITSDRPGAVPAAMASSVQRQFVFRLAAPHEYAVLGISAGALDDAPPGRAVEAGDGREIQFALAGEGRSLADQAAAVETIAEALRARDVEAAPPVESAPERVSLSELPAGAGGAAVYDIGLRDLAPVVLPERGLCVIAGPSGSGLSQAALTCAEAVERLGAEQGVPVDTVLLSFDDRGLQRERTWGRAATGPEEVALLAGALVAALGGASATETPGALGDPPLSVTVGGIGDAEGSIGGALRGGGAARGAGGGAGLATNGVNAASPETESGLVFPSEGHRGVIVVERPAAAEATRALPRLIALAKAARRANALVLFEHETGVGSGVWELFQALKQPAWGLALQPDGADAQSPFREDLGRVRRSEFPPGRGFAVCRGRVERVQVAHTGLGAAETGPGAGVSDASRADAGPRGVGYSGRSIRASGSTSE